MARDEPHTSSPYSLTEKSSSKWHTYLQFRSAHSPEPGADGRIRRDRYRPRQARSSPPIRSSAECGTFCNHPVDRHRRTVYDQQSSIQNRGCCSFLGSIRICSGYLHDSSSGRDIRGYCGVSFPLLDVDGFADRLRFTSVQVVFVGGTTSEGGQCQCSP